MKTYYGEEKIQGRDTSSPSIGDRKCWKWTPSCGCETVLCLSQVSLSRFNYEMQQGKYSHFVRLRVCMKTAFAVPFSLNINIIP